MSNGSLDYQKLCSNYYSSYEDGCCMESCEFYNHNECPIVYVNGLLEKKDEEIAQLEKALELACGDLWYMSHWRDTKEEVVKDYIEHFKTKAKEIINESKS